MKKGFALIEMLIGVFILVTVGLAVAGAFVSAIKSVTYAKTVIAATALANTEMEKLHNLPYNDLATDSGEIQPPPSVLLPADKTENGFKVHTRIWYYDDPFDGTYNSTPPPYDPIPIDYKKISISVGLENSLTYLTTLNTNIGAKARETETDTGVLEICVKDSARKPVGGATVTITNFGVIQPITTVTDGVTGCTMIPNLPEDSHNGYHIVVTRAGYSTSMTYPRTSQNPNAVDPDRDVFLQDVTSLTLYIDRISSMEIQFLDNSGNPIPDVAFTLEGLKLKYNNPDTPIYSESFTTDAAGNKITISDLEFDDYMLSILNAYRVIALSPSNSSNPDYPLDLPAGVNPLSVIATLTTSAADPSITSISPTSDQKDQTVTINVLGDNFQNGLTAKLYRLQSGRVEIVGTTTFVSAKEINTVVNLAGAMAIKWNLEIVNPDGSKVVLFNGFEVTN